MRYAAETMEIASPGWVTPDGGRPRRREAERSPREQDPRTPRIPVTTSSRRNFAAAENSVVDQSVGWNA
jgi:hypothetical protein